MLRLQKFVRWAGSGSLRISELRMININFQFAMSWGKAAAILVRVGNYCTEIELNCEDIDYGLETAKRDWQDLDTDYRDFIHKGLHAVSESNLLEILIEMQISRAYLSLTGSKFLWADGRHQAI